MRFIPATFEVGDIVAALPAIRALGGGDLAIGYQINGQRESMAGNRFEAIKPLLEAQPYISSVKWSNDRSGITHDFSGFRKKYIAGESLAQMQWSYIGLEGKANLEPWLTVEPNNKFVGRVIFARSNRYHNELFPLRELFQRYRDRALFVGIPSEFHAFQQEFGVIQYAETSTGLLSLARVIAACSLFIGNQSCPFWIAAGLGVPIVQETWSYDQNSVVRRPNAIYSRTDYETSKIMEKIKRLL